MLSIFWLTNLCNESWFTCFVDKHVMLIFSVISFRFVIACICIQRNDNTFFFSFGAKVPSFTDFYLTVIMYFVCGNLHWNLLVTFEGYRELISWAPFARLAKFSLLRETENLTVKCVLNSHLISQFQLWHSERHLWRKLLRIFIEFLTN